MFVGKFKVAINARPLEIRHVIDNASDNMLAITYFVDLVGFPTNFLSKSADRGVVSFNTFAGVCRFPSYTT